MTGEEAKAALRSTDPCVISLQSTIRKQTEAIATYEKGLAEMGQDHPGRTRMENLLRQERQGQQEAQASLARLVQTRARLQETIEKMEA